MEYTALGKLISKAKVEKCGDRSFPVLSMTMHDGIVFQNDRFKKDIASVDRSNYSVVKYNQLVVSFPIDEGVLAVQDITEYGIVSPAYKIWDINRNLIIPKYLEMWLRSPKSIDYYKSKLRGTTARRRSIPEEDFLAMPVAIPTKEIQEFAIDLIRRTKKIIELKEKEIAALDEIVKARFVEMFGDIHDEKCSFAMIGDICRFQQGTQIPVDQQIEEKKSGYKRFLRIIDYTQAPQPPRYVNVDGREIDEKSVVIVRYGATAGFVGRGYKGILANNLFEVVPNEQYICKDFLYLALKYGTFERDVHEKAFGAAMPAISFAMMNDIPIAKPTIESQQQFVGIVQQIDKTKLVIQKALEESRLLFDSLMQQYFG